MRQKKTSDGKGAHRCQSKCGVKCLQSQRWTKPDNFSIISVCLYAGNVNIHTCVRNEKWERKGQKVYTLSALSLSQNSPQTFLTVDYKNCQDTGCLIQQALHLELNGTFVCLQRVYSGWVIPAWHGNLPHQSYQGHWNAIKIVAEKVKLSVVVSPFCKLQKHVHTFTPVINGSYGGLSIINTILFLSKHSCLYETKSY